MKIAKIIFTTIYIGALISLIYFLCVRFAENGIYMIIISFPIFVLHIAIWVAPKWTFNTLRRIVDKSNTQSSDSAFYDLPKVGLGFLIFSLLILVGGLLFVLL